uniref:Dual-specificity kinase n=1 Tax=Tetraselmis sp. GSL018 TaxID=582737 RepID=A0A061RJ98_9CHLO|eukprot:CAMPEP_0177625128 /NCGR_PEP_ID=MMETSP0419_2-20121207/29917_1 /TAXON_ID=582737 /ORGANISM="Tetraselmis sp., Strain GSL018" /LENGTH=484 /DNA_ID=CAMNT_0019126019 /DNA_START=161 /DNA_END=1615 /DNA_ORIENTATION=-
MEASKRYSGNLNKEPRGGYTCQDCSPQKEASATVRKQASDSRSSKKAALVLEQQRSDMEQADVRDAKRPRQELEEKAKSSKIYALPCRCTRVGIPAETDPKSIRVPDRPSPPLRSDDKDGHYRFVCGENFSSRYKILSKMGEGTFGRVLECWDRKRKDYVAIKVVRNVPKYRDAAMIELEVLNTVMHNDPASAWHCVRLREWFDYRGHICMVFEKLGPSLFDFLRKNRYRPFPLAFVRRFAEQLIEAVAYLHRLSLVHTDLKPENILLAKSNYNKINVPGIGKRIPAVDVIRLIDFGSATFEEQYHSTVVSTRHYRAPEVILGMGWSFPCDIWSIGCIVVELLTGDALFQTHENFEHLAMMEAVLGRIPEHMIAQANRHMSKYFYKNRLDWPRGASSIESELAVKRMQPLSKIVGTASEVEPIPGVHDSLLDLLSGLLRYEPDRRMTAEEALQHPFFSRETGDLVAKSSQHLFAADDPQPQKET